MARHPTPQVHGSMWAPSEYTAPHYQSSYSYQPPPYEYLSQQSQQQGEPTEGGLADIFLYECILRASWRVLQSPTGPVISLSTH
ncbi:hypothetical protein Hanom_Chr10g00901571 [Helianthus anomalus]